MPAPSARAARARRAAGPRHLLRHAACSTSRRRRGGARRRSASTGRPTSTIDDASICCRHRRGAATPRVDEPRRPRRRAARRASSTLAHSDNSPVAALRRPRAAGLRRAVPPRGRAHAARQRDPRELPLPHLRAPRPTGRWSPSSTSESPRIREQVGDAARDLRPLRRRRLVGRGGAGPPGDRRSAHLHLRRQRPAARGRGASRSRRVFRDALRARPPRRRRRRALPENLAGRRATRSRSARSSARVHRGLRGGGEASSATPTFLAQGTLYPDVIESVSFKGPSATIKSHHNVGGLPERMQLELVEPLRELFKDEVRALGARARLPDDDRRPPAVPRARASRSASSAR